jgi:probable F420-dependent oxidoreductase
MLSADDLGVYVLPGRVTDPIRGLSEARIAEVEGLGSVWLAERWETKELGVMCGALSQVTTKTRIVAGMTHFQTRHPSIIAGLGQTMQLMSGNRFVMGFGKSVAAIWRRLGVPVLNNQAMADYADILRRLWNGETVDYDGPAGRYPAMRAADIVAPPPPMIMAAIGPKTLALAGRHFDGVVLHPLLTTVGVAKSSRIVRQAAEEAGRDPDKVKIYATVIVAPGLPLREKEEAVDARAVTYLTLADAAKPIMDMNGWDSRGLEPLLTHPLVISITNQTASQALSKSQLIEASRVVPADWIEQGAAAGSVDQCALRLAAFRKAGADELVLHGATADRVGPLVRAYESLDLPAGAAA